MKLPQAPPPVNPPAGRRARERGRTMRSLTASLVLLLSVAPVTAFAGQKVKTLDNPGRVGSRQIAKGEPDFYSREREIEMGKQMARQLEELATVYTDPATEAYVQRLTDRIVRHSDAKMPVVVKVILSNEVDAFALPGGRLYLTTGLILRTRNEDELAGVIAHEVAHIAARDATRQMTRQKILNWMSLPMLMFGGPAYFIGESMNAAGPLALLMFNRSAERRADNLGLQYLYDSGYDPLGFVNFFERARKLEKDPHGGIARAFSTHPLTRDRVRAAEREIERDLPPRAEYVVTTSAYLHVRSRIEEYLRDQMPLVPAAPKKPVLRKHTGKKDFRPEEMP
jgi:predicted Zn-dependent protease